MAVPVTRLFFHAYDHPRPLGGQRHVYQQVDALAAAGLDAWVVHNRDDLRLTWFASTAPVIGPTEFAARYDPARDLLVLPEDLGDRLAGVPGRKVIFHKGIYNGFAALDLDAPRTPYEGADVVAALAVSARDAGVLRHAYPSLPVFVTRPGVDLARFTPRPLAAKQRRIAWVGKNRRALAVVRHVLASRARAGANTLADVTWVELAGLHEAQLIDELQRALVLVFLGVEDGHGLLPREALACGCVPVAFDTGTLDEVPAASRVPVGDVIGIVRIVEDVLARRPDELDGWQRAVERARDGLLGEPAAAAEAVAAWREVLARIEGA